jgi:hypothetical protein
MLGTRLIVEELPVVAAVPSDTYPHKVVVT